MISPSTNIFRRVGTVYTDTGEPVTGAIITIKNASVPLPEIAIVTDANGRFEMQLPKGVFTLRAYVGENHGDAKIFNPDDDSEINVVIRVAG